jgi:two-component system sensor histidine kinase RegB
VKLFLHLKRLVKKSLFLTYDQFSNQKKITKSIEIVYGLRNFIGNANKFSNETIHITLKSDSEITEITIEDDGNGYPKDVLSKIGEPYLRTKGSN